MKTAQVVIQVHGMGRNVLNLRDEKSEMRWMYLPQGLDEPFEIVRFERLEQQYDIWSDKKKHKLE